MGKAMSIFRLNFSGEVRKPQVKTIGADQAVEFQLMRKNYGKGPEATFTWIRVTLFKPQAWQIEQCREGGFVSGSGEFTLRSFEQDGVKRQSAEVRCSSFDLDGPRTGAAPASEAPAASPVARRAPSIPAKTDDAEPPW
jgi:single-stranded DNA-binding protein